MNIPPHSRGGILASALQEVHDLSEKARLMHPPMRGEIEAFDPLAPTLATCGLEAAQVGRLLQRCLMSEGFVPKLCQGERSKGEILQASIYVVKQWEPLLQTPASSEPQLDPMVECAVCDIVKVGRALVACLSDSPGQHGDRSDVTNLVDAKHGLSMLIKQACSAQPA